VLNRYNKEKKYFKEDYHSPILTPLRNEIPRQTEETSPPLSASAIWLTYEALQRVNRPENESGWQYFASSPDLAWKTGTSFGFRDGWAVGTTPKYVVGVWVGNATGEGRPGLTGITAAAPLMFDLISLLGSGQWFKTPSEDLTMIRVCTISGFRAGPDCPETTETQACLNGLRSEVCPFHQLIHLNKSKTLRVTSDCFPPDDIINEPWFILPPAMEYFYKMKHAGYKSLPPLAQGCSGSKSIPVMEFIYPTSGIKIFIPRDQTGELTKIITEVAHRNPSKKIFWHLDERFIGTTRSVHQLELVTSSGNHILTAVDEDGNTIKCEFTVI
jgi:penicillin-binding protein 1C